MTHGCVGADLAGLCREAALIQIRSKIRYLDDDVIDEDVRASLAVTQDDFRVSTTATNHSLL